MSIDVHISPSNRSTTQTVDGRAERDDLWSVARPGRAGAPVHALVADAIAQGLVPRRDRAAQAALALRALAPSGPRHAPPRWLLDLVEAEVAGAAAENPVDLVIAIGAGWRRQLGVGGWDGCWPAAVGEVMRMVQAALVAIGRPLGLAVPRAGLGPDDLVELPSLFTVDLLGGCDCGHHRRSCRQGACGRGCCYPDHDLHQWDPARCHLRPFIDQAVTGTARGVLQGGAFAESMLYRLLVTEGRLMRRKVEFCRCSSCGTLFEGSRCPGDRCLRPRDETTVRVKRVNWLVTPTVEGGDHDEVVRVVCPCCENLFQRAEPTRCPACTWTPGADETAHTVTVWAKVPTNHPSRCGRRTTMTPD